MTEEERRQGLRDDAQDKRDVVMDRKDRLVVITLVLSSLAVIITLGITALLMDNLSNQKAAREQLLALAQSNQEINLSNQQTLDLVKSVTDASGDYAKQNAAATKVLAGAISYCSASLPANTTKHDTLVCITGALGDLAKE